VYRIRNHPEASGQIAALPDEALEAYAQVLGVLELVPWNGMPHNNDNPDGSMRQVVFGLSSQGYVIYLILEDQRLVDVLRVVWLG